ncbi:MAG: STAS domain-containing protein [Ignavibacteria bacterium]|nr:STAS domain-containing protein [Ignavibacteria bacterium]
MTEFKTSTSKSPDGVCVISIGGYLDAHTASDLERNMQQAIDENCTKIVVDFATLEYISSAGLGVFMVFIEPVRLAGGDIKLAAMTEKVFSVFDLLGFPALFTIYKSVPQAIESFSLGG